ncbi:MAG: sulfatase-like hydrolase/transferase [Bryobacter sp.]|nr:sulfatase-like hydrolase/transferase [Bryobacter sp.]
MAALYNAPPPLVKRHCVESDTLLGMISRRHFLGSLSAPLLAQTRQPNILLVLADDMGFECLAANGATTYRTPNLDRMAAQGLRFTHAHSMPLCTPTRVQLMTGQYNFRNYTEFGSLPPGSTTFAHLFQQAGYRTGVTGKWQLAGHIEGQAYKGVGTLPRAAGFDESRLWQVTTRGSRYWDPLHEIDAQPLPIATGKYGPDLETDFACQFLERHRNRPFLFYYPMNLTHDPFVPTPASPNLASAARQKSDPLWFKDMVEYCDHLMGRLLNKVDDLGLAENTLVLFLGDNGTGRAITTPTRSGPVKGGKGSPLSTGTHVPLLARWIGHTPRGRVCEDLIDSTDFFPTLCQAAGIPIPARLPRDGRSLLPQLEGRASQPREWLYFDYNPKWGKFPHQRWVMNKEYKLYDDGRALRYSTDPLETQPIALPAPLHTLFPSVLGQPDPSLRIPSKQSVFNALQ